ncbi:inactive serine protease 54 isoform X2 [Fukomys damarensis]|uniref:inactive serine protease 54 isoform X2 n=1 Tax=Fukomys damarensis TaxID=885580 RepID=UPI00053FF459|nr:inactive serine protease 54 isoform X2 [Fukomys damarensis]
MRGTCCPWCLQQFCVGMAEMRGMLLVLLYVSQSSASCGIQKTSLVDESEENLVSTMEFPWVVSVQDSQYTHLAFGCILSHFWILSIASAFQNRKDAIVVVGIANMDPRKNAFIEYPVRTIIIHEDFDNHSMNNNVALLRTDSAMHFDDLVQPICFLGKEQPMLPALKNCWVSGWNPTSATGNHMTMSILRRISVKDFHLCPLHKPQKTGCGSHTERETDAVCLGEPGSPMMCQLQHLDLWVLRGILTHGGEKCPGLFLYTKVEDYSDWITSMARRAGPPLSSLRHWEKLIHFSHHRLPAVVTQKAYSEQGPVRWPQSYFQGQRNSTVHLQGTNSSSSRGGPDLRVKGLQKPDSSAKLTVQPMYYDYYGGDVGKMPFADQDRVQPQEIILVSFMLVFFGNSV